MRRILTSLAFWCGVLGFLVAAGLSLGAYHLYTDHAALHVIGEYLNRTAPAINRLPAATPPTAPQP